MSNQNPGPAGSQYPGSQPPPLPGQGAQPPYPGAPQQPGAQPPPLPGQGAQPPVSPGSPYGQPTPPAAGAYGSGYPGSAAQPAAQPSPGYGGQPSPSYGGQPSPNYGAQPGYGAQAPQGGYPGQSPYAGGNPPGGPTPPAPPAGGGKGGMGKWIAIGALALVVILAAIYAISQRGGESDPPPTTETTYVEPTATGDQTTEPPTEPTTTQPTNPSTGSTEIDALTVGECMQFIEVPGATPDPIDGSISVTHETVDCTLTGQFKLQVVSVTEGDMVCPNDDYVEYFQESTFGTGNLLTLCLAPVLEVNHCYLFDNIKEWIDVPCDNPDSYFMVESELPGTTDASTCSYPDSAFILPEPAPGKVYCVA